MRNLFKLVKFSIIFKPLGIGPHYFNTDFKTLGFLFESLCIRDLKVYSSLHNGKVSYYHDRYGLEAVLYAVFSNGQIYLCSREIFMPH